MANDVIFEKREITNFESVPDFGGLYAAEFLFVDGLPNSISPFSLEADAKYVVEWDNTEYTVIAIDGSAIEEGAVGLGNGSLFGIPSAEPFAIIQVPSGMVIICMDSSCTSTTHTVAIYQEESGTGEDTSTGIIVKDRDGNDVIHKGAYGIRARTMDGGTKVFVDADTLAKPVETSVELDFSSGDMEVLPGDGEVFSEVNIPKPVSLIPENIAKDVNIAGIVGSLSGGGGSFKCKFGSFNAKANSHVLEHGLGMVPSVFLIIGTTRVEATNKLVSAFGISQAFAAKLGNPEYCNYTSYFYKGGSIACAYGTSHATQTIETTETYPSVAIHGATKDTITIGSSGKYLTSGSAYRWMAFGLLEE